MTDPDQTPDPPNQRGIIHWFAHNHVAANLLMVFIIIMGVYGAYSITLETMPNVQFDQINVRVAYLGAAPAEVEEGVVIKIEEAVENVEGIKEIHSFAFEGMGQVTLDILDDGPRPNSRPRRPKRNHSLVRA